MGFQIYDPSAPFRAGLTASEQLAQSIQQQREKTMLEPYIVPGAQSKLALQEAQTKLYGAQTQKALTAAKDPFSGTSMTGTAAEARSTMLYKKVYGENPYAMSVLKNAVDRKQAMANSRYLNAIPASERGQMIAVFKAHNIDPLAAVHLMSKGYSEQEILNLKAQADVAHQKVEGTVQPSQTAPIVTPQVGVPSPQATPSVGVSPQPPITGAVGQVLGQPSQQPAPTIGAAPAEMQAPAPVPAVPMATGGMAPTTSPTSGQVVTPQHIMSAMTTVAPGAPTWQTTQGMYAPQPASLTRAQESAQGSAGLDYLGDYIAKNIQYGGITAKVTRPWLRDAYSSDPAKVTKAVNYYVAQAVKSELALYRMRIIGGMPSARAMVFMTPGVMGKINVDSANTPASFQRRVMLKANNVLNGSALAMQKQTLSKTPTIYKPKTDLAQEITQITQQQQGTVTMKTPDGKIWHVPANKVAQAIKMKAVRI